MRRLSVIIILALGLTVFIPWASSIALTAFESAAPPPIKPQISTAHRTADRVFLEKADRLVKMQSDSFVVALGNVEFSKGPMRMYCDSAHFFPATESFDAYGNVRMRQGDTLFVYADELNYNAPEQIAYLYADAGKKVKMINKDVTLETDVFTYDLKIELGYYDTGGVLYDRKNRLTSREGEYTPSTKEANFYTNVHLHSLSESDTLDIYTDSLYYNTASHVALLTSPGTVVNPRGIVYTSDAVYETDPGVCFLYNRSLVKAKGGQTLIADTIIYREKAGYGEAFGNMILTDSAKQVQVTGDYGYYSRERDSSFVTGRTTIKEYSKGDTLYMHGKYLQSFLEFDTVKIEADTIAGTPESSRVDTFHISVLYPQVRFYRSDMQGVCDSMRFTEKDSTMRMFVEPVVWSEQRQIFGEIIELHFNDSTIDKATLPKFGFSAELVEEPCYNQISGKEMIAWFENEDLKKIDISGNVEMVLFPEENDSTINKFVKAESSYLTATFNGKATERVKMWPETNGVVTPLYLARRSNMFLSRFKWYGDRRPKDKDDIYPKSTESPGNPVPENNSGSEAVAAEEIQVES